MMQCPACGHPNMVTKTLDEILVYGGQSLTLHKMTGEFCEACGEGIWDEVSYRRYTEAQTALIRSLKGDIGADIRRIRKSLNLTQTQLAEAFGLGKVAFSRYEQGKTRPSAPVIKLLKIVEKHTELLEELQKNEIEKYRRSPTASRKLNSDKKFL